MFSNDYFTCQCNPPVAPPGSVEWPSHRIPIDCMTAEDWKRVAQAKQERAATVYVVSVVGDQDCGAPNAGAIGVYEDRMDAWTKALEYANEHGDPEEFAVRDDYIRIHWRGDIVIEEFHVQ